MSVIITVDAGKIKNHIQKWQTTNKGMKIAKTVTHPNNGTTADR